jgi:radical SAM/Cys-rich protein
VELEADYRRELYARYQIVFNRLYALANLPIRRFGHTLLTKGQFDAYMELLRTAHKPQNLDRLMCRSLVSVDWQGFLYDCDFNQMLNLSLSTADRRRAHLSDLESANWEGRAIRVAGHCYGCTAGAGSSCSGALAD